MAIVDPASKPVQAELSAPEIVVSPSAPLEILPASRSGESETTPAVTATIKRPPKPKRFEIFNKTPRRIAIHRLQNKTDEDEYLFISPFSTKVLSEDIIRDYGYQRWEQEDLIDVKPLVDPNDDSFSGSTSLGCFTLLGGFAVIALLVPFFRTSPYTWIILGLLVLVTIGYSISGAGGFKGIGGKLKRLGRSIMQAINLALLLIVVIGLSAGLFYLFSGGKDWVTNREFTVEDLGRVIQYLFLAIATLLPALMYFLFNRQQREKIQEDFIREVLYLDPGIRTISEAESKYLSLVQETFGTSDSSGFLFSSGLPILLCTLLIFMGWLLVLQPFTASSPIDIQNLESLLLPRTNAVTFAFLGAYFFAVSMVFRRYVRADLTPKTYTHIILRLLLAIILAWTLSALPVFAKGGSAGAGAFPTGLLYLLAFFIGIFPETGLTVLQDLAHNPLFARLFPRLEEDHPLTRLDGINLYDRSRFLEEGIENIENLAHHNLIGLMLSTPISTSRLVDMFDQAILYLHLGLKPENVADARETLRAFGIRTATDLEAAYQSACAEGRATIDLPKFLKILPDEKTQPESLSRIQTILDTLRDDDWMTYLRNWRELTQRSTQTVTLKGISLVPLEDRLQKASAMAY